MTTIEAIFLGLVQGTTEFLPVSSSGHLVLIPYYFRLTRPDVFFDVVLHLGTLFALMIYFWSDLIEMVRSVVVRQVDDKMKSKRRLTGWLALGTVPAVLAGIVLKDFFESLFSRPLAVSVFLIMTGVIIMAGEKIGNKSRSISSINWRDACLIGLAQAMAIIPGISRSGMTVSAGLMRGLDRESSARFAFLLAIPVTAGAGIVKFLDVCQDLSALSIIPLCAGFISALISGWLVIRFFIKYVQRNKLYYFAYYCLLAGTLSTGMSLFFQR